MLFKITKKLVEELHDPDGSIVMSSHASLRPSFATTPEKLANHKNYKELLQYIIPGKSDPNGLRKLLALLAAKAPDDLIVKIAEEGLIKTNPLEG